MQNHTVLATSNDLANHNCAIYSESKSRGQIKLVRQQQEEIVYVKGNFMSNHLDLIKKMVLNDACLGILLEFMVVDELKDNVLIRCLENYALPENNLYAIYPKKEFMLPRLSCFLKILIEQLNKD